MPRKRLVETPPAIAPPPVWDQPRAEDKREKFKRLGQRRMERVLHTLHLLGNLSSPNYGWTAGDVELIRLAILTKLGETLARFDRLKKHEKVVFSFQEPTEPVTVQ